MYLLTRCFLSAILEELLNQRSTRRVGFAYQFLSPAYGLRSSHDMNFAFDQSQNDLIPDVCPELTSKVSRNNNAPSSGNFGRNIAHMALSPEYDISPK
jgi:hypothetical protein